jgi:5-methylcytosine-specific restriction protein B
MSSKPFTWIPIYTELAQKLLTQETRQYELITMLEGIREQGFVVTPFIDRDTAGERSLIQEMDPFTFFGTFNRKIRFEQRVGILAELKQLFSCESQLPTDFDGVPILNNQRSWFVGYEYEREPDAVARLWNVFRLALSDKPLDNPEFSHAFDEALEIRGVNVNLTMGLFWIRPDTFLNLDATNRSYLGIDLTRGLSSGIYKGLLEAVSKKHSLSFVEISKAAYEFAKNLEKPRSPESTGSGLSTTDSYWFVGAYWDDRDPPDQTQRFMEEGVWENGYTDRYLDLVKAMRIGERIAIKAMGTQKKGLPFDARGDTVSRMTIKAIGTIVKNRGDGRTVEVEWDNSFEPKDWYFFTYQKTVWRIRLDEDYAKKDYALQLIQFAFFDAEQDYDWFRHLWGYSGTPPQIIEPFAAPYSVDDILSTGSFVPYENLQQALNRLEIKKALILQGAPGVGKTFLAKRLAYALMGEKDDSRIRFVQFHQSYSYEDFVRGYRPSQSNAGVFELKDGIFFELCETARREPDQPHVFIIDEINRGNLSQIFGELLMLIEADKREPSFAIPLMYKREDEPDFYVPNNVYLIGTMNLADRSLALVDYALRRRFAFMTLNSAIDTPVFRNWLQDRQMDPSLIDLIIERISVVNADISDDTLLGERYQIGHSFFCPRGEDFAALTREWYEEIVKTEIIPLLNEYWFDNSNKAQEISEKLLAV